MSSTATRFPAYLWPAPLLLMAALLYLFPRWMVDDAYIAGRYAAQFLETGQIVWNVGEAPLEGFTGYVLPALMAFLLWAGIPLEAGLHAIGAAATLGTLILIGELFRKLRLNPWIAFSAICLYALSPQVYVHAFSGLETNVFTFILMLWLLAFSNLNHRSARSWKTIVWIGSGWLMGMTRPEGILVCILGSGWMIWAGRKEPRKWLLVAAAALLPLALFQAWRWWYFGALLPNSVQAKAYPGLLNPESLRDFASFALAYLALPLGIGFLLHFSEADNPDRPERERLWARNAIGWLTAAFAIVSLAVYARSHLFMNYSGRFFAPLAPLALACAALLVDGAWASFATRRSAKPQRWRMMIGVLLAAALMQAGMLGLKWRGEWAWVSRYQSIMEHLYKPAAAHLKARLDPQDRIICYMDAGAIPYFSRLKATDFGRLNDRTLPGLVQGSRAAVDYFFAQDARAAVFTSIHPHRYNYLPEADSIMADPRFGAYKLDTVLSAPGVDDYYQFIYMRGQDSR